MDNLTKSALGLTTGLQATALVGQNIKLIPKFKGKKIKSMSTKKMLKVSTRNLLGVGMVGATADVVNSIK